MKKKRNATKGGESSGAKAYKAFEDLTKKLLKVPKKELPKDEKPKPEST